MAEEVQERKYIKPTEVDASLNDFFSRFDKYIEQQKPTEKDNMDVRMTADDEKAWKVYETQIEEGKPFYYDFPEEEETPQEDATEKQKKPQKRGLDTDAVALKENFREFKKRTTIEAAAFGIHWIGLALEQTDVSKLVA